MRLPNVAHTSRPWRIHELARDFRVEDVWALPTPGGNYLPAKTVGSIVYLAGVISTDSAGVITGTVGVDRTIEEGYAAARACALTQLAVLKRHLSTLDC